MCRFLLVSFLFLYPTNGIHSTNSLAPSGLLAGWVVVPLIRFDVDVDVMSCRGFDGDLDSET